MIILFSSMSCSQLVFFSHSRILSWTGKDQLQRYQRYTANLIACEMSCVPLVRLCLSCLQSKQDAVFWRKTGDKTGEEREENVWTDWRMGLRHQDVRVELKPRLANGSLYFMGHVTADWEDLGSVWRWMVPYCSLKEAQSCSPPRV